MTDVDRPLGPLVLLVVAKSVAVHRSECRRRIRSALFADAKKLVGEYGSALHRSIFAAAGTVVCALRGPESHPGFVQSGIGAVLGQPTGYVIGEPASGREEFAFSVGEAAFDTCLRLVFDGISVQ